MQQLWGHDLGGLTDLLWGYTLSNCFLPQACVKHKVVENLRENGNSFRDANLGHHHKNGKTGKEAWHTHGIHRTGLAFLAALL